MMTTTRKPMRLNAFAQAAILCGFAILWQISIIRGLMAGKGWFSNLPEIWFILFLFIPVPLGAMLIYFLIKERSELKKHPRRFLGFGVLTLAPVVWFFTHLDRF
jgi:hypothetical protein